MNPGARDKPSFGHKWIAVAVIVLAATAGIYFAIVSRQERSLPEATPMAQATAPATAQFAPTIANAAAPPGPPPHGMVWIPGGEFSMGAVDPLGQDANVVGMQATTDSRPIHRVYVDGFWMDATEVTNRQFAEFVKATGYVTVAERTPTAEEFPGAPPENLIAGSVVFSPPDHAVPLDTHFRWWAYVAGRQLATPGRARERPEGPRAVPGPSRRI